MFSVCAEIERASLYITQEAEEYKWPANKWS